MIACITILCLGGNTAHAQLPIGRLNSVFPAGGQSGSNFTAKIISGTDLDETKNFWFSHPGIRAVPTNEGIEGSSEFHVSIDPSVPRGTYEFRAGGLFGLSNPRLFMVGSLDEVTEVEPNSQRNQSTQMAINQTANGQILGPGDIDWFRFVGDAKQRILIECESRRLDSKLKPRIELIAPNGRRIARARGDQVKDAMIDVTLPTSGEYLLSVSDQTFAGSNEHVYRLTVHDRPHIDFVIPAAVPAGKQTTITVFGRNLPRGKPAGKTKDGQLLESVVSKVIAPVDPTTLDPADPIPSVRADVDGFAWRLGDSNPVLIHFAQASPIVEAEPNDSKPQQVNLPFDMTAQFQNRSDVDVFEFEAAKGKTYRIDVVGQRMSSPIDPWFIVEQIQSQPDGKQTFKRITTQDDTATNIGGNDFLTAHGDPHFQFQAPADSKYRLTVRDRFGDSHGHSGLVYRVIIKEPKPEFRLVALSGRSPNAENQPFDLGSLCVRRGGAHEVTMLATRRDGFSGPIRIRAENLPRGVECKPVWLGANQTRTTMVFTASQSAPVGHSAIRIVGESQDDHPVSDVAQAATIIRRTGGASESRLSDSVILSVLPDTPALRISSSQYEIHTNQSKQIIVPIEIAKHHGFDANVNISFVGQPKNIDIEAKPIAKGSTKGAFRFFLKNNAAPGTYTIIPRGKATVPFVRNPWKLERAKAAHAPFLAAVTTTTKALQQAKSALAKAQVDVTDTQKQLVALTEKQKTLVASIATAKKKQTDKLAESTKLRDALTDQQKNADARTAAATALRTVAASLPADEDVAREAKNAQALVTSAEKAIAATKQRLASNMTQLEGLKQEVATASSMLKQIEQDLTDYPSKLAATRKVVEDSTFAVKKSEQALAKANTARAEADKRLKAAQEQTKPVNINVYEPSTPIVLHIVKSPVSITATAPNAGTLKQAQTIDVAVTIKRDGYDGPMTLSLVDPSGSVIVAPPVSVPSQATSAVIKLTAKPDAATGPRTNTVIRATFQTDRVFEVETPIALQVQK